MSLLYQKPRRGKQASSRRFRVSVSPYASKSNDGSDVSTLLSAPKSLSSRTLDRNAESKRKEYLETLQGYTRAQHEDLETVRREIGWTGTDAESGQVAGAPCVEEDDSDSDWADESENQFRTLSVAVAHHMGMTKSSQTWAERLAKERDSWERNISSICNAYLAFNRTGPPPAIPATSSSHTFSILCIHLTDKSIRTFTSPEVDIPNVVTLARHGYIPPTPSSPECAIHVDVLRYCAALRRHASSISLQSIASAICEVHNTTYARHFRTHLSAALDVYLAVTRMIDSRLAKIMSRDDPDWRMANFCAACTYKLQDEPELKYSMLLTCDGNDSLKRVANASVVDHRVLNHSYFLDSDYVDRFENEIPRKQKSKETAAGKVASDTSADSSAGDTAKVSCEPHTVACEERWKNARADDSGKKVVIFEETGMFAVSCRHGFVVLVEDMRSSGELSKYGLAAVDKLCRVYGDRLLIGYDIGCTFRGTVQRSPLVGPLARKHKIEFVVGSFHGYAHNRKCQLVNHPLNFEGAGLESFEENEQLFSSTNTVALTTRHASAFHRRQLIVLRLSGWDLDRRCALGSTLKSKYTSALRILATLPKEIHKLCPGKTDDYWRSLFHEERNYFESLKSPSQESSFAILYVNRLRVLAEKQKAFDDAFKVKITYTLSSQIDTYRNHPTIQDTDKEHQYQDVFAAQIRALEAGRTAATEQLLAIQTEVARMEEEHAINPRWVPECAEWKSAVQREALEDYHRALRELESLVVQRIAELEKAHSVRTGYKARMHMSKSIKRREKAIHSALKRYNSAASTLDPPRPKISFKELADYAYLANFDLLKYSEHGLQGSDWSQPVNRRCVDAWQKIERAKEEIQRLNVEIRRVQTQIHDEDSFLSQQHESLKSSDPDLAHVLHTHIELTTRVHQRIQHDLTAISNLKGFTGDLTCGQPVTSVPSATPVSSTSKASSSTFPGHTTGEQILTETLADLSIDEDGTSDSDEDEVEPSDEAQQAMMAIEENCKVM